LKNNLIQVLIEDNCICDTVLFLLTYAKFQVINSLFDSYFNTSDFEYKMDKIQSVIQLFLEEKTEKKSRKGFFLHWNPMKRCSTLDKRIQA